MKTTAHPNHRTPGLCCRDFPASLHLRHFPRQLARCQAFTRIELVVAIIVSCLLAAALFLPTFPAGRARTRSAVCLNNLRQIDLGLNQYAVEFQQFLNAAEWGAAALDSAGDRFQPYLPDDPQVL